MFASKAGLPENGAPERSFTLVDSGLTWTHFTRLERLARVKHSSLSQTFVNYGLKKFYNVGNRREFEHLIELPCLEDLVSKLEPFLNFKSFWGAALAWQKTVRKY